MLTQAVVDAWLDEFLGKLREAFGERLVFLGNHGSWARGEADAHSDIDTFLLLDRIEDEDLRVLRDLIASMPYADAHQVSAFVGSLEELRVWPRYWQWECWFGCRTLHGDLRALIEPPSDVDYLEDVRHKASENLQLARHYLLHPHDMTGRMRQLRYPFKESFYALQSWLMLTTGTRYDRKTEMLDALDDPDDIAVVTVARGWHAIADDRPETALAHAELLERWSRKMLARLAAHITRSGRTA